jgi:hypothetical protein
MGNPVCVAFNMYRKFREVCVSTAMCGKEKKKTVPERIRAAGFTELQ